MNPKCSVCKDSKHVRKGKSWIRCQCAKEITNSLYIKYNIRCGEISYPSELDSYQPLKLQDFTVGGDYHAFRKMVWRSIAHYETVDLLYDYFDAYRLVEIYLGQDSVYTRIRDLDSLGLVVISLGVSDLPNRMLAPLMCQLLTQRKMAGVPTWIYSSKIGSALRTTYGNELADLLGDIKPNVYELLDSRHLTQTLKKTSYQES